MSNETRGLTQCHICALTCNNYNITQHAKRCKFISQESEDNDLSYDPENVENTKRQNERSSLSDSASFLLLIAATATTVTETVGKKIEIGICLQTRWK